MKEALLKPRVVGEFLRRYNGSPVPSEAIALNVIGQMGVPQDCRQRAYEVITRNAEDLGLLVDVKGRKYIQLDMIKTPPTTTEGSGLESERPIDNNVIPYPGTDIGLPNEAPRTDELPAHVIPALKINDRVFITHGKNHKVVEQIRKILLFGKFEPVVPVDLQTVAKPIPDKVMDDMRGCAAAIVHVGAELRLMDSDGHEHAQINPNVLIEIGAAMALYKRRFVLLVERGVNLPSNLLGLYEVRYEGEQLDHEATMKLLEAFNDFRR